MAGHSLLSPSSSHRWLNCPPSVRLEQQFEEKKSSYAEEGAAAHALSEYKIKRFLGLSAKKPESSYHSQEMEDYTDVYVDFACELIAEVHAKNPDSVVSVEQKLDFSEYVPKGFGTGDLLIVARNRLDVVDLKYGKGIKVDAENNPQMMLYALGALAMFGNLYDIREIRMTICQPRLDHISTAEISAENLVHWAETVLRPRAELAIRGEGEFCAGEHCRFCRARFACRERAERNLELARLDFKKPAILTENEIAEILSKAEELTVWASDIKGYALEQALKGKKWTGFKLVEGRSVRKYRNEDEVAKKLLETGSYTEGQIYSKKLLGITAMEKLLGKKRFSELLDGLIEKPTGKPTLVPDTDKRPEFNTAIADFNNTEVMENE